MSKKKKSDGKLPFEKNLVNNLRKEPTSDSIDHRRKYISKIATQSIGLVFQMIPESIVNEHGNLKSAQFNQVTK